MLKGKSLVVGVCGGIAAYKVVEVVSRLKKLNADVNVIMTKNATNFVAPLTFQSISHNLVVTEMFDLPTSWDVEHITLARRADLFVVAPATANIIGKVANGIADDMLSTTIMATKAKVLFVPAMNQAMYENSVVQENIHKLKNLGYLFMEPEIGLMAAEGEYGKGRLPEPKVILEEITKVICPETDLKGIKVLITAGPTREPIDPVRYISNYSSGKMGYAIAHAAVGRGAEVKIVSGPVKLQEPLNVEMVRVNTAQEMHDEVMKSYSDYDVFIMVAAVADYRCTSIANKKIKKSEDILNLELIKNPDIAGEIGKVKGSRILVGFSAETNDLENNAKSKLESKNFDMIVANDITAEGAGFNTDTNIVKIIKRDGSINSLPKMQKSEVANAILNEVRNLILNKKNI